MDNHARLLRITRDALLLALLCVVCMFSIPLGENIKVSLQLLIVFLIALMVPTPFEGSIITGCYLLLGLFLPIYAGFSTGISPTFGYVISFVVIPAPMYFFMKIPRLPRVVKYLLACLLALITCYAIGTGFMMAYLGRDIGTVLMISVVPYVPFDLIKIGLTAGILMAMPKQFIPHTK